MAGTEVRDRWRRLGASKDFFHTNTERRNSFRGPAQGAKRSGAICADVAVEHLADMKAQIHFRCRNAFLHTALVEDAYRLLRLPRGVERGGAGAAAIRGREYREDPVADQLFRLVQRPAASDPRKEAARPPRSARRGLKLF